MYVTHGRCGPISRYIHLLYSRAHHSHQVIRPTLGPSKDLYAIWSLRKPRTVVHTTYILTGDRDLMLSTQTSWNTLETV
jgi:hypothetical protein